MLFNMADKYIGLVMKPACLSKRRYRQAGPTSMFFKYQEPNELAIHTEPIKCAKICSCARSSEEEKKSISSETWKNNCGTDKLNMSQ